MAPVNAGMPHRHRELLFRVWDGEPETLEPLMHLYNFVRREEILEWLIRHHFTGKQFVQWVKIGMGGSPLKCASFVISKLEREKKMRDLLFGKDYLP